MTLPCPSCHSTDMEKYQRIFHATPDYATFSSLDTGIYLDVNPGFEKMIGFSRDEVERICNAVAAYPWQQMAPGMKLSASIGVACHRSETRAEDTFSRTDQALYAAKSAGRNRVVMAPSI